MPASFIETNVLVDVTSSDPVKAERAEMIIADGGTISVQVLNELANVACRKMRTSWSESHALLSVMRALLSVQPITVGIYEAGLALAERYSLSVYDAVVAASTLHAHCDTLWPEDMDDGMVIQDQLRIANPFRLAEHHGPPGWVPLRPPIRAERPRSA